MDTIVDVLQRRLAAHAERVAFTFAADGEHGDRAITWGELDARAQLIAQRLIGLGAEGRPVLVLCPAGLDYVSALLGCSYASAIAVPAYAPTRVSLARTLPRVLAIAEDCTPTALIATRAVCEVLHGAPQARSLESVPIVDPEAERPGASRPSTAVGLPPPSPEASALLQYTSGSTARPKGVLITHAQLLANLAMICASGELTADDVFLSWLPPYHDMGLIGGIFTPLYLGAHAVLMPPDAFIRKPRRWLEAAERHGATILMAPNFAFELCVRRIPESERRSFDLRRWRVVYNGAEPIHAATLDAFTAAFAPSGFRREAFYPCYGMAEATLIISGGRHGSPPVVREYAADELELNRAVRASEAGAGADRTVGSVKLRRLVGCGRALLDEQILIVDPVTLRTVGPKRVGEIWVKSGSVASGYWRRPDETVRTFGAFTADTSEGPFLRTGDLGFFDEGELFITGRMKDLIIVRGLNHYPHDIERTVQALDPSLVADGGAAFALETSRGEQLVVVQEFDKRTGSDPDQLISRMTQAIREAHDLAADDVVLIKRGTLLKTSSGKVQRSAIRAAYLADELHVVARLRAEACAPAAAEPAQAGRTPPQTETRPRGRERAIVDFMREHLARRLRLDADAIDPREPLARYGVDSLIAAELTEALERHLGAELPATISYDNPTIEGLARALAAGTPTAAIRKPAPEATSATAHEPLSDPIAIVGMACRFPGAPDLAAYWRLLRDGVDAIGEIPRSRWDVDAIYDPRPGTPGKMCSRFAGLVPDIDEFDAAFFGISAREAQRMDPQQRLFLEVAWEALEDAGAAPQSLAGSDAGVFAGVCTNDYAMLYGGDLQLIDGDYGTGASPSIVANRLSYVLDLKGPSETIDSACSSALVALQHACQALRNRDCDLAIVGGVNAVLAPESSVYFSRVRALAPDGRCKTFDARADGFVRGEGAGVVVLKRLSRAQADGDRIYALIAGSSVNHDGRSNGLLSPNGTAQQEVIRRALRAAQTAPRDVDYVEAHGVGTPVADAVELRALGAVMSERDSDRPLLVGSVKTNIGHLEAASGMAALIKVALALDNGQIPPHLHLREPHPDLGLSELPIAVPTRLTPWPRGLRPRFAGVSAFGFGGTNAHVVLREAPLPSSPTVACERPAHLFALSAKSEAALRSLAQRMADRIATLDDARLADACFTANAGRAHFDHRVAIVVERAAELRALLSAFAAGAVERLDGRVHTGRVKAGARVHVGLVFREREVQSGAARALYEAQPRFRQALELASAWLAPHLDAPLLELLYGTARDAQATLRRPSHGHAALVALQYALHTLWRDLGLEPIAVYGSGAGEFAAAAATGVFSWEQALILAARRGLLLESVAPGAIQKLSLRQYKLDLAAIDYLAPSVPLVSGALGRAFTLDELPDAQHWMRHAYHVVQPDDGAEAFAAEGCDVHLELGPAVTSSEAAPPRPALPSLAGDGRDVHRWLATIATLYTRGVALDFRAFDAPYDRRKLALPSYPFEHQRYWLDFPRRAPVRAPAVVERPSAHPLFGQVRVYRPDQTGTVRRDREGSGTGSDG